MFVRRILDLEGLQATFVTGHVHDLQCKVHLSGMGDG